MKPKHWSVVLCFALGAFGCGRSGSDAPEVSKGEETYTAEEKPFAVAARPFLEAMAKQDYPTAYGMLSAHVTKATTLEQFKAANEKAATEFGRPTGLGEVYGIEIDRDILKGPAHQKGEDKLDLVGNQMGASDAVGEMSDAIPFGIRRASVKGQMIFGKDKDTGDDLVYLLTVVLVEENGQLKVGHYWFRNLGLWD